MARRQIRLQHVGREWLDGRGFARVTHGKTTAFTLLLPAALQNYSLWNFDTKPDKSPVSSYHTKYTGI